MRAPNLSAWADPICVTGGAGFIGSHVVRRLRELGREVRCLVLPNDPAPLLDGLGVTRIDGDVLDPASLDKAMDGCELVIHLAAVYALWLPDPTIMFRVNVDGTRNVLKAARRAGVKRVVYTSSIAAVGTLPAHGFANETTAFDSWDIADDYVLSKVYSEQEALKPEHLDALDVVAVNPAFPFGPGDIGPTPTGRLILAMMRGHLPFVVKGGFNGVDVRDVAEGHLLAAELGRSGERYLLAGHNMTYEFFGKKVAELCGGSRPLMALSRDMMLRLGAVTELGATVAGITPLFTKKSLAYIAERYLYFSTLKAEGELGYVPGPLEDALKDAITWFGSEDSPHDIRDLRGRMRDFVRL